MSRNKSIFVTTMFDYYGMPVDTPGMENHESDLYRRMELIEERIYKDMGEENCFFNLMLHEFESLLFSNAEAFGVIEKQSTVSWVA